MEGLDGAGLHFREAVDGEAPRAVAEPRHDQRLEGLRRVSALEVRRREDEVEEEVLVEGAALRLGRRDGPLYIRRFFTRGGFVVERTSVSVV